MKKIIKKMNKEREVKIKRNNKSQKDTEHLMMEWEANCHTVGIENTPYPELFISASGMVLCT